MTEQLETALTRAARSIRGYRGQIESKRRLCMTAADVIEAFIAEPDDPARQRDLIRVKETLRVAGERRGLAE